jgi:hypothetical protein
MGEGSGFWAVALMALEAAITIVNRNERRAAAARRMRQDFAVRFIWQAIEFTAL